MQILGGQGQFGGLWPVRRRQSALPLSATRCLTYTCHLAASSSAAADQASLCPEP